MTEKRFEFQHKGIGKLLKEERLMVPPNQRSYAWEQEHVQDLFQDLSNAISQDESDYFLGTIVLTQSDGGSLEVSDGQQRLATITILLARMRDYFIGTDKQKKARSLDHSYLRDIDLTTEDTVPKLRLNVDDNEYFRSIILDPPDDRFGHEPTHESNKRIADAAKLADEHIKNILRQYKEQDRDDHLVKWVKFIENNATVVVVTVPNHIDAYRMFETLNDRGLRASQADLLKNYLFSRARNRLPECQAKWAGITGSIETVGRDDVDLVTYIRHFWITQNGPTRERELAERIKSEVKGETRAVKLLSNLEDSAQHYVALFNPEHAKWNKYKNDTRNYVKIIAHDLRVSQIRPLLFAVSAMFPKQEAEKAFRMMVSWSVRFLIVGGRGGMLDVQYARRAFEIGNGTIQTAKQLGQAMKPYVPNDAAFEEEFRTARVSKTWLARYYLRALDLQAKGESEPELKANEDSSVINLEHVMPKSPGEKWDIDSEIAAACQNRLGNMVLMKASNNVAIGNSEFETKKDAFKNSSYIVTSRLAEYGQWTLDEINDHQVWQASLAVKAWPLNA